MEILPKNLAYPTDGRVRTVTTIFACRPRFCGPSRAQVLGCGRRYRLRAFARPELDPAKGRFARGVFLTELNERTRHGRLSLRKMLPLMRGLDVSVTSI